MTKVELTVERRWWNTIRRRHFSAMLPGAWSEAPSDLRLRWWGLYLQGQRLQILKEALRCPYYLFHVIAPDDLAALMGQIEWMRAVPDCVNFPISEFSLGDRTYYFPSAQGANMACLEFALADEYYAKYQATPTPYNLALLTACLCREANKDEAQAKRRDDVRCLLYSRTQVEQSAKLLQYAPLEIHTAALLYFAGMKQDMHRIYKTWLFEDTDTEEDEDEDDPTPSAGPSGPDFGWWGVFQMVAESGLFGDVNTVYQASIHDVCVYLVRKRVEAEETRRQMQAAYKPPTG